MRRCETEAPEVMTDLAATRVIRQDEAHAVYSLLGLGTSRNTLSSTPLLHLGGLDKEVEIDK